MMTISTEPRVTYSVRLMTLSGRFDVFSELSGISLAAAKEAVEAHAAHAGYSNVRYVEDDDPGCLRATATTPGGRRGRNVAFIQPCCEDW